MSLFEKPPAGFPFAANVSTRPTSFTLRSDISDSIVTTLLAVFWVLFGTAVIYSLTYETIGSEAGWETTTWWIAILLCLAYIAGALAYFTPAVLEDLRTVDVTITDTDVAVTVSTPISKTSWSDPIATYEGVANMNLGMHDLGDEKVIVGSVVLKHPDPSRSVPLIIREQQRIGRNTASKIAGQFNLPVLEGVGDDSGEAAYPDGTLVVNKWQARKVRLVYWGMVIVCGLLALFVLKQVASGEVGAQTLLWLFPLAGLLGAMQVFGSCYVTAMREWRGEIWVRTASLQMSEYKFAPSRVKSIRRFEGKSGGGYSTYNSHTTRTHTPWLKLSVQGYVLPFVIDLQAEYVNEKGIDRLTGPK